MPRFKLKKIPKDERREDPEELLATFCYHFPQYTYKTAKRMPYLRIIKMLKAVRKEQAQAMIWMIHALVAGNSTKKKGVEDGIKRFSDIINEK